MSAVSLKRNHGIQCIPTHQVDNTGTTVDPRKMTINWQGSVAGMEIKGSWNGRKKKKEVDEALLNKIILALARTMKKSSADRLLPFLKIHPC